MLSECHFHPEGSNRKVYTLYCQSVIFILCCYGCAWFVIVSCQNTPPFLCRTCGVPRRGHRGVVHFLCHNLPKAWRGKHTPQSWRRPCRGSMSFGRGQTALYTTPHYKPTLFVPQKCNCITKHI